MDNARNNRQGGTAMDRIIAALRDARTAVLTTAGFACGTAALWTQWGVSAGLGGAGVSLLLLEALTSREAGK